MEMMKRILPVSIIVLSVILFFSFKKMDKQVVCFGDSITHGAEVDGQSWVWFLSKEHSDIDFVNAGRNGRKTADKQELVTVL